MAKAVVENEICHCSAEPDFEHMATTEPDGFVATVGSAQCEYFRMPAASIFKLFLKEGTVNTLNSAGRSLILLLAVASLKLGCNQGAEEAASGNGEEVVMRVGEDALTLQQLVSEIPSAVRGSISSEQLQRHAMRWANHQLLYQEAKRRGLDRQPDVQWRLKRIEVELLGDALVESELNSQTWQVSDSEVQKFYNDNNESFKRSEAEILVWHLVTSRKETADSLRRALAGNSTFSQLARERAQAQGETTPWEIYYPESEVPEAAKEILRLRPGAISTPIAFDGEYHLFFVVERFRPESIRPLRLVRDEIAAKLKAQKQDERYRTLLAELFANTKIEKNFHLLENIAADSIMTERPAQ